MLSCTCSVMGFYKPSVLSTVQRCTSACLERFRFYDNIAGSVQGGIVGFGCKSLDTGGDGIIALTADDMYVLWLREAPRMLSTFFCHCSSPPALAQTPASFECTNANNADAPSILRSRAGGNFIFHTTLSRNFGACAALLSKWPSSCLGPEIILAAQKSFVVGAVAVCIFGRRSNLPAIR